MPFGLCNAPLTFQRFLSHVLRDFLDTFVLVYIDDILIFSTSVTEHHKHLTLVFQKLRSYNLTCKQSKCVFAVDTIDFCGHRISASGIRPFPEKLQTLRDWPVPRTVRQVRRFLGFCQFYAKFVPRFAHLAAPLQSLIRTGTRSNGLRLTTYPSRRSSKHLPKQHRSRIHDSTLISFSIVMPPRWPLATRYPSTTARHYVC